MTNCRPTLSGEAGIKERGRGGESREEMGAVAERKGAQKGNRERVGRGGMRVRHGGVAKKGERKREVKGGEGGGGTGRVGRGTEEKTKEMKEAGAELVGGVMTVAGAMAVVVVMGAGMAVLRSASERIGRGPWETGEDKGGLEEVWRVIWERGEVGVEGRGGG